VLSRIAEETGTDEAIAALATVLGETALLAGNVEGAVAHFERALEALRSLCIPLENAEIRLRAGVALARAGERARAVERLTTAYRTAKKLGARPLTLAIVGELAKLGEKVEQRLGRRASHDLRHGGLSR
jgi:Flp pilus assembly protein TadD